MKVLDISNNQIGYEGARCISLILAENDTLEEFYMKLNFVSDKAGQKFFEDIMTNNGLRVLDLSANLMTDDVSHNTPLNS